MKKSLSTKILVLFTLMLVLQTAVVTAFLYLTIKQMFTQNIQMGDERTAEEMAVLLGGLREETGDWSFLTESPQGLMMRSMGMGMGRGFGGLRRQSAPLVVFDPEGRLVFSNIEDPPVSFDVSGNKALKIVSHGQLYGYLLLGSMADPRFNDLESRFLVGTLTVLSISGAAGIVIWFIFGSVILRRALRPLKSLMQAMNQVRLGVVGSQLVPGRLDEIGMLTVQFNQMSASLKEDREYRKRLVADTAHELRTPLSVIGSMIEMIIDGHYEPNLERMKILQDEVERFSALVGRMHELSALDEKENLPEPQKIRISEILEKTCGLFGGQARKAGVDFRCSVDADLPEVAGTEEGLMQIASNLFSNALRAVSPGGRIEVAARAVDGDVEWCVDDDGPGIPEEMRTKVFQRFFRIDSSRNRENGGTGLGLSIVKGLIGRFGGEIAVEDSPLGGARIKIRLPGLQ